MAVLAGKALGPVYGALAQADLTIALSPAAVTALADPRTLVTVLNKDELDASDSIEKATAALAGEYASKQCRPRGRPGSRLPPTLPPTARRCAPPWWPRWICSAPSVPSRLPKKHGNMSL